MSYTFASIDTLILGLFVVSFALAVLCLRHWQAAGWVLPWCALTASGICFGLSDRFPPAIYLGMILGSLFPVLLLAAALRYAGRRVPPWLLPAGLGIAVARAAFALAGLPMGMHAVELVMEPILVITAAGVVHRHVADNRPSAVHWLLAPTLLVLAGLEGFDGWAGLASERPYVPMVGWIAVGIPAAAVQIISMFDAARRGRARAEAALLESEERFQRLAEHSNDLITELDADGRLLYVSPNARKILGYDAGELVGQAALDVATRIGFESSRFEEREDGIDALLQGALIGSALRFSHRDDSVHWLEVDSNSYRTAQGESRVISVSRDITERVRAEEERLRWQTQMQQAQKLESLGVLAGGIAHEFNNLLVGILGTAEVALGEVEAGSALRGMLVEIQNSGMRASDLIHQLLAYAGKGSISPENIQLATLVEEVAELVRAGVGKNAVPEISATDGNAWIHADTTQVHQVILNLITNAAEALNDEAGTVAICTGVFRADNAYLADCHIAEDLSQGDYAYVEVRDTGCGMDENTLNQIFDPFFTSKFQGRGLGLAAVPGVVRSHKGALWVQSEPGLGTTFRVLFPLVNAPVDAVEDGTAVRTLWGGEGTVLVVDDEPGVLLATTRMVERLGFRSLAAKSGEEALAVFRAQADEIIAVLLDITMPQMPGERVFAELRRIRSGVPVVFMSGFTEEDLASRIDRDAVAAFVQKPFRLKQLDETLRGVLDDGASTRSKTW